jgi:hypothetical protein|tara:strand:- start:6 stop:593 length:588 start_codon:yes stop_codon:yes gene_type:complete
MSLNISQEHLDYCSDVSMTFVWNAFSTRQQTSIIKPLKEGTVRDSDCTTVMIANCIAKKLGVPLIRISKWSILISPEIKIGHPVWEVLKKHYQMCKVILPEDCEEIEEDLEQLALCEETPSHERSHQHPLHFDRGEVSNKLFTEFKKELVFPVKLEPEQRDFLERLEEGKISHLKVKIDQNSYNYTNNMLLKEDI